MFYDLHSSKVVGLAWHGMVVAELGAGEMWILKFSLG